MQAIIILLCSTVDINECSFNNGGCEQVCSNTVGSFQCDCNGGHSLNGDGRTCSGRTLVITR